MTGFLPSELPVRARTRHHWVALFARPHTLLLVALGVLVVAAVFKPNPMAGVLVVVLAAFAFLRWQTWRAEWIILTGKRIIRVQGVPETTSTEASMRIDRVSGARLIETVPGKLLGYGTIELEAPGDHPDLRRLVKINEPRRFYQALRRIIFDDHTPLDAMDEDGGRLDEFVTAPLPVIRSRAAAPRSPRGSGRSQRPRR